MNQQQTASAGSGSTAYFRVLTDQSVNIIELTLPQSLDSDEFDWLNTSLSDVLSAQPGTRWVLDLTGLSYMGSSALGLMVNLRQRVKSNGGHLVLCGLSPRLLEIFRACCMEKLFDICKTREDAIKKA